MNTSQPKIKIYEGGFSVAGKGAGGTKYYQVGSVAPSSERNELRVIVNGHENLVRALFFAAYQLSEGLAHGPGTASVQVAHSDEPPIVIYDQDINLANPEGLTGKGLSEIYERLGINDFRDIVVGDGAGASRLEVGQHTIGLGIAAVEAYMRRDETRVDRAVAKP